MESPQLIVTITNLSGAHKQSRNLFGLVRNKRSPLAFVVIA